MRLKDYKDPKYTKISIYTVITVTVILIIYHNVDGVGDGLVTLWNAFLALLNILQPVFWGFFFAYLMMPLVRFLDEKLSKNEKLANRKKGVHGISVMLSVVIMLLVIVILLSIMISTLTQEIQVASLDSVNETLTSLFDSFSSFVTSIENLLNSMSVSSENLTEIYTSVSGFLDSFLKNLVQSITASAGQLPAFFTNAFLSFIFCIYFLSDGENISRYWGRAFKLIFGDKAAERGVKFLKLCDRVFSGYIRGQVIDAVFMAVIISITLSIVGVRFSVLIGVLAGIGNLIPYVGPFVAYIGAGLACIISGDWIKLVIAEVLLFIVQGIDGQIVNPKLLGNNVNIHPMYVVIALTVGGNVGGLIGMLFAVPVAALIKECFDLFIAKIPEKKKKLAKERNKETS